MPAPYDHSAALIQNRNFPVNTSRSARSKRGMDYLAKVILDSYSDIKRIKQAMSVPNQQWKLLKKDPQGPDSLNNMRDYNNDGVPDIIIANQHDSPLFVNGYTTKPTNWPNDALYYNAYPTNEARQAIRNERGVPILTRDGQPVLNARGESIKRYSKKQAVKDLLNPQYYAPLEADSPEQVGTFKGFAEGTPQWYFNAGTNTNYSRIKNREKRMSPYDIYREFIFKYAYDEAMTALPEEYPNLTGQDKMAAFGYALNTAWYQDIIKPLFNRDGTKSKEEVDKLKKSKEGKAMLEQFVNQFLRNVHDDPNAFFNDYTQYIMNLLIGYLDPQE